MIKNLTSLALFAAGAASLVADATELTRLLPAETDLVILVDDVPRLREASKDSPGARAWQDPEIQAWLAPLREKFDWAKVNEEARAETGSSPEEVLNWIEGGAVLAIRDFGAAMAMQGENVPFIIAIDFGGNLDEMSGFLERMARRSVDEKNHREEIDTYGGVDVHGLYPPEPDTTEAEEDEDADGSESSGTPMFWAADEGLLFLSSVKQEILDILDTRQDGGAATPLAGSDRLERLREIGGQSDLIVSLRLPRLVGLMESAMAAKAQAGGGNPMIPPARNVITGLGLDAWEDVWFATRFDGDESIGHYGLAYREPRGLLTLLQHEARGFPQPEWIPAEWKNVAVYRFEAFQLLPRLQQILSTISPPMGGMIQGMLAQMQQKTGVDLQRDILGRFGDEMVAVQRFESMQPGANALTTLNEVPQMMVFSLNDAPGFEQALNTLIKTGGPAAEQMMKTRDYLGYRITSIEPPTPPGSQAAGQSMHFAITDRYFFLGMRSASVVEEALQALSRGGGGFWDREDVGEALDWAPADATGFQVQDMASVLAVVVPGVEAILGAGMEAKVQQARAAAIEAGEDPDAAEAEVRAEARFTDPERAPSPEVFAKYFGNNWSIIVMDDTSLRAVVRTRAPNP